MKQLMICLFLFVGCQRNLAPKSYLPLKTIQYYSDDYVIYRFGKLPNVIKIIDSSGVYNFQDTFFLRHLDWEKSKR